MSQVETAPPARNREEIVTFWDITKKQFRKNRQAMAAVYCVVGLILFATAAPVICLNIPYVMKGPKGLEWPLFDSLFNRLVFPSGVDLYFNLLLIVGPAWLLGGGVLRNCGIEGNRPDRARILAYAVPLALLLGLLTSVAIVQWKRYGGPLFTEGIDFPTRGAIYFALLDGLLGGLAFMTLQSWRSSRMKPRQARTNRVLTRVGLFGLFLVGFLLVSTTLEYTAPIRIYRTEIADIEASGEGWALSPFFFEHPDNKAEDNDIIFGRILKGPSRANILGTDNNGRDVWARILYGTRISLTIGIIAVSIYGTIGTILGSLAGYFGGRVDLLIIFVLQVMICIPGIFLILTIVAVFESRSIFMIMLAIGLVSWTGITRLVRGEFLRQRNIDYVTAARALGIPQRRIIFGHILKNAMSPVLVALAFGVAAAILTESFLSFIGLGDTNAPSWGQLLQEGRNTRKNWLIFAPGMAIFFVVTVLNLVGDGLRDALDPKLRQ